jgi:hypothetical protein
MNPITPDSSVTLPVLHRLRVTAEGCSAHVLVYEHGLTIGSRPGRGRLVTWSEVARLSDGPPADRFGVVVNGRLLMVLEEEADANDRAADQRQLGLDVAVIRVPVSLPS